MAEFNPTLPGAQNLSTPNADETINRKTFLTKYLQTVFRTFKDDTKFMDKITKKILGKGAKSGTFYFTGTKQVQFLKRAEEAKGNAMLYNDFQIALEDLMYCDSFIADIDDIQSVLDVIAENAREDGIALALELDKQITIMINKASGLNARVNNPDGSPRPGGTQIEVPNGTADDPEVLLQAVKAAAQSLDEKNVPKENRWLAMRPAVFYTLLEAGKILNADFSKDNGDYAEGRLKGAFGFKVITSNTVVDEDTSTWLDIDGVSPKYSGLQDKYNHDCTGTLMLAFTRGAVGMVMGRDIKVERARQVRAQGEFIMTTVFKGMEPLNPVEACLIKELPAA